MSGVKSEIERALANDGPIPREHVLSWIESAADLSTLSKLYRLTGEGYYRIQPELGAEVTCALIQRYLLQCMRENVQTHDEEENEEDHIESRFEAAQLLHAWFLQIFQMKKHDQILKEAARAITDLYVTGDEAIRNCVETGFLEHVLETEGLRPYFEHWSRDERLQDSWKHALAWGKAHPDMMARMFEDLRKLKSET